MQLSLVVAIAQDGAIGRGGTLPWHLPADLKFFKQMTVGKAIIMGRKTWESLNRKALPNRLNIVLSRNPLELPEGVLYAETLDSAVQLASENGHQEAAIVGGASLFAEATPKLDILYITQVETTVPDADTFFPELDMTAWKLDWEEAHEPDEKNKFHYTFQRWVRK
jgi:dihydrofolate reductase